MARAASMHIQQQHAPSSSSRHRLAPIGAPAPAATQLARSTSNLADVASSGARRQLNLHKSFSNLASNSGRNNVGVLGVTPLQLIQDHAHSRSKSTPHQGFVL